MHCAMMEVEVNAELILHAGSILQILPTVLMNGGIRWNLH